MADKKTVRGIRNNNPFNLVKSNNNWLGKVAKSTDSTFEQFETMEQGIRAGLLTLRNGYYRKGLKTVEQIILKFCPIAGQGNTAQGVANYISVVSEKVFGMPGTWKLDTTGKELKVAYYIMVVECGYSPVTYAELAAINTKYKIF